MTFTQHIRRYEAHLIRNALSRAGGSVTKAARELGFKSHQTLIAILNNRHKGLRKIAPKRRHKPVMTIPKKRGPALPGNGTIKGEWEREAK